MLQCLQHIENQTVSDRIEVIVVSDGHDEDTAALFNSKKWNVPVRFSEIEKSQQGVARNRGVQEVNSPLCLFIGDDTFLAENACEHHLKAHAQSEHVVLGFTTWDPAVGITPVMQWLEQSGWQFGYPKIAQYAHTRVPQEVQHQFSYTTHISLPSKMAKKYPFREDVHMYGWEDIEWGKRLSMANIPLVYEPNATALHHHKITLEDSLKRMETLGKAAVVFEQIDPNFDRLPQGLKLLAYKVASLLPTMAGKHRKAFLQGIRSSKS